ncbi:MAG: thermonuclease family protein [Desulfuromonadales bacterium]|nr:thermonuclease family protein [Desulfuromonadales bacterium]
MLRTIGLLFVTVGLLTGQTVVAAEIPASLTGTVNWVYDADTFDVAPHGKVRLLGVDAPEKANSDRDRNFTGLGIAQKRLRSIHGAGLAWGLHNVKGRQVTLTFDNTRRDRHGRLLAYVHLPDGRLLNRVLLEEGLVIVYRRFPIDLKQDFLAAEARAKNRGVGLWAR